MIKSGGGASGGGGLPAVGRWSAGGGGKGANGWQGDGSPGLILVNGNVHQSTYAAEGWVPYVNLIYESEPPWADRAAKIMSDDGDVTVIGSGPVGAPAGASCFTLNGIITNRLYRVEMRIRGYVAFDTSFTIALVRSDNVTFKSNFSGASLTTSYQTFYCDVDCNGAPYPHSWACAPNSLLFGRSATANYTLITEAHVKRL